MTEGVSAFQASSTTRGEGTCHTLTFADAEHFAPRRRDGSHPFVTAYTRRVFPSFDISMDVAAADPASLYRYNYIIRFGSGVFLLNEFELAFTGDQTCAHVMLPYSATSSPGLLRARF